MRQSFTNSMRRHLGFHGRNPPAFDGWDTARMCLLCVPILFLDCLLKTCDHIDQKLEVRQVQKMEESMLNELGVVHRKRKRALTNPLPATEGQSMLYHVRRLRQRTDEQATCSLLTKLPLEIRQIIYEQIVAGGRDGNVVHFPRRHARLGDAIVEDMLIPLLQTCRVIYSEAIQILYSKTTFNFQNPQDLCRFRQDVLPQRLDDIRSVVIDWKRQGHRYLRRRFMTKRVEIEWEAWRAAWLVLAGMTGMQELRVRLTETPSVGEEHGQEKMCVPMMAMENLRVFELSLPPEDKGDWSFAADAPFTIVRRRRRR